MTAKTERRSPRKAKGAGHLRRGEILEAAEQIFVAQGYEGATIRKIAEAVGVSSTALYMHFPDKAAILREISDAALSQLIERNRAIAAHKSDATERVREMLESYMRWGLEHPNAYQLVYALPQAQSSAHWLEGAVDRSHEAFFMFRGQVEEIAAAGRLSSEDPNAAAQALWAACHGLVTLITGRPNFPWADHETLVKLTLDGMLGGLLKR